MPLKMKALIEDAVKHAWQYDPVEVRRHINKYKVEFLFLKARYLAASAAYEELRRCIQHEEQPKDVFFHLPHVDLVSHLYGRNSGESNVLPATSKARHLPTWFRSEVEAYLKAPRLYSNGDLSYWLVARLLQDGHFMDALELVRKRWHIGGDPLSWYRRMDEEQAKLFAYCAQRRVRLERRGSQYPLARPMTPFDWPNWLPESTFLLSDVEDSGCGINFPHAGGVRFLESHDFRDTSTYEYPLRVIGLGFPIHDYDRDLAALAWLAGGDPESSDWRVWIEVLLWDFVDQPKIDWNDKETVHWEGFGRNVIFGKACQVQGADHAWRQDGKVRGHPDLQEVMTSGGKPGVRFLSRWVHLSDYSESLQPELVYAIVQEWGDYEEPPDRANLRRAVRAFAEPQSAKQARKAVDIHPEGQGLRFGEIERKFVNSARKRHARQSSRKVIRK